MRILVELKSRNTHTIYLTFSNQRIGPIHKSLPMLPALRDNMRAMSIPRFFAFRWSFFTRVTNYMDLERLDRNRNVAKKVSLISYIFQNTVCPFELCSIKWRWSQVNNNTLKKLKLSMPYERTTYLVQLKYISQVKKNTLLRWSEYKIMFYWYSNFCKKEKKNDHTTGLSLQSEFLYRGTRSVYWNGG